MSIVFFPPGGCKEHMKMMRLHRDAQMRKPRETFLDNETDCPSERQTVDTEHCLIGHMYLADQRWPLPHHSKIVEINFCVQINPSTLPEKEVSAAEWPRYCFPTEVNVGSLLRCVLRRPRPLPPCRRGAVVYALQGRKELQEDEWLYRPAPCPWPFGGGVQASF